VQGHQAGGRRPCWAGGCWAGALPQATAAYSWAALVLRETMPIARNAIRLLDMALNQAGRGRRLGLAARKTAFDSAGQPQQGRWAQIFQRPVRAATCGSVSAQSTMPHSPTDPKIGTRGTAVKGVKRRLRDTQHRRVRERANERQERRRARPYPGSTTERAICATPSRRVTDHPHPVPLGRSLAVPPRH